MASNEVELPVDVWREIFKEYCLLYPSASCVTDWDITGPWLLSRVCNTWRSIVLDTPTLWSRIYAAQSTRGPEYLRAVAGRLECQLLRSQQAPLHIQIDFRQPHLQGPAVSQLLHHFMSHSNHWEHADIALNNIASRNFWFMLWEARLDWPSQRRKDPFPILRSIKFEEDADFSQLLAYPTPELRRVTIPGNDAEMQLKLVRLAPISHCDLYMCSASTAIPLLLQINATVEDISCQESVDSQQQWISPVSISQFTKLRRLRLTTDTSPYFKLAEPKICSLLRYIIAPSLEQLTILVENWREPLPAMVMETLSNSNSAHILKQLTLRMDISRSTGLSTLLEMLPSLEDCHLELNPELLPVANLPRIPVYYTNPIISSLFRYTASGSQLAFDTCPRLRKLYIKSVEFNFETLADIIALRYKSPLVDGSLPLQDVTICSTSTSLLDWMEGSTVESRFQSLGRQGLQVEILSRITSVLKYPT